jgi:hypothetical protein
MWSGLWTLRGKSFPYRDHAPSRAHPSYSPYSPAEGDFQKKSARRRLTIRHLAF